MRAVSLASILAAVSALACASCANFKFFDRGDATTDEPESSAAATPTTNAADEPSTPDGKPKPPVFVDDGFRLPDMTSLPSERELRRPQPEIADEGTSGISARPPVGSPEGKDD